MESDAPLLAEDDFDQMFLAWTNTDGMLGPTDYVLSEQLSEMAHTPPPSIESEIAKGRRITASIQAKRSVRKSELSKFTAGQKSMMNRWITDHIRYPYLKEKDRQELTEATGLSVKQINRYVSDYRRRKLRPQLLPAETPQLHLAEGMNRAIKEDDQDSLEALPPSLREHSDAEEPDHRMFSTELDEEHGSEASILERPRFEDWSGSLLDWFLQTSHSIDPLCSQSSTCTNEPTSEILLGPPLDGQDDCHAEEGASETFFPAIAKDSDSESLKSQTFSVRSARLSNLSALSARSSASFVSRGSRRGRRLLEPISHSPASSANHARETLRNLIDELTETKFAAKSSPKCADSFRCDICQQAFARHYTLSRHVKSVHGIGGDAWVCRPEYHLQLTPTMDRLTNSLECPICHENPERCHHAETFLRCWQRPKEERTFYRKDAMREHIRRVHGPSLQDGCDHDGAHLDVDHLFQRHRHSESLMGPALIEDSGAEILHTKRVLQARLCGGSCEFFDHAWTVALDAAVEAAPDMSTLVQNVSADCEFAIRQAIGADFFPDSCARCCKGPLQTVNNWYSVLAR